MIYATRFREIPVLLSIALLAAGCHDRTSARSDWSFDEIVHRVGESSAGEVEELLGEPDSRRQVVLNQERWIWWNYTFLAGSDYPPEVRGRVVHLEITFRKPVGTEDAFFDSDWRIVEPFGIVYWAPVADTSFVGSADRIHGSRSNGR